MNRPTRSDDDRAERERKMFEKYFNEIITAKCFEDADKIMSEARADYENGNITVNSYDMLITLFTRLFRTH